MQYVQPGEPAEAGGDDAVEQRYNDESIRPHDRRPIDHELADQHRHQADQHLPERERERLYFCDVVQLLCIDHADRPAHARDDRECFAEQRGMHLPGFEHGHQAGDGQHDGDPLQAVDALMENRPREHQHPEGHRENQDRRLAGASLG